MCDEKNIKDGRNTPSKEVFAVYLTDGMLYDKLHRFAAEFSVPVELLADLAVKRLTNDIEFVRDLRLGNIK